MISYVENGVWQTNVLSVRQLGPVHWDKMNRPKDNWKDN